jgi:hypothetical protein
MGRKLDICFHFSFDGSPPNARERAIKNDASFLLSNAPTSTHVRAFPRNNYALDMASRMQTSAIGDVK